MNKSSLWIRTGIIIVIAVIGIIMVFGPRGSVSGKDFTWQGIKDNLSNNINLGLDLKGGSHLLMRVKIDDYLKTITTNNKDAAVNAAKEAGLPVGEGSIIAENGNYQVKLNVTDAAKAQEIVEAVKKKVDFTNWTESVGGSTITWSLPAQTQKLMGEQAVEQALRIIESRINSFGVKEPTLQRVGASDSGQILLQMPGVDDPERVKKLIGEDAKLELMKVVGATNPSPMTTYPTREAALQSIGGQEGGNRKVLPFMERPDNAAANQPNQPVNQPTAWVVVETPAIVDGSELRDAIPVSRTGNDNDYQISFSLKPAGAAKFGDWTGKNIGAYMAVVLNEQVKSAPYIRERITDQGQIDGRFTKASADDLVLVLKSGALPAKIEYQEERTVGPSLGADSIRAGVTASIGGLAFVIIFMLIYYRGSGVNAVIALILNMLLTMAGLIWLDSTLTLPGIAGLILGIGMAVDSNVLIFERIREEVRAGKTVKQAIDLGFDRAFVTIVDTHITTILSSLILFLYGTSLIKGFAVTLILGLLINLFTAVFVSRTIFMWLLSRKTETQKLSI
jgi:preprotein translocase subunit SecD